MLTMEEALSLATYGERLKPIHRYDNQAQLFDLETTPIWREFLSGMRVALKRCKAGTVGIEEIADHNIQLLHKELAKTTTFKAAVRNATTSQKDDHHWYWQSLLSSEKINAGLLTVYAGQPIPLHDHPGANGMIIVLQGKVRVSQYQLTQELNANHSANVALRKISDRHLGMGETDMFLHNRGNIHGMRALSQKCIILDILIPPQTSEERSWYLPTITDSDPVNSSHIFARRVQGEYFLNSN